MENQRIRVSKKMLKDALTKLLSKKPINRISIKEICDVAGVNRTTFYKYYTDEYSLLLEIEQEYLDLLVEGLSDETDRFEKLLIVLSQNPTLTQILFLNDTRHSLFKKMFKMPLMTDILKKSTSEAMAPEKREKVHLFIFSGIFALVVDWFEGGLKITPNEFAKTIRQIIVPIVATNRLA